MINGKYCKKWSYLIYTLHTLRTINYMYMHLHLKNSPSILFFLSYMIVMHTRDQLFNHYWWVFCLFVVGFFFLSLNIFNWKKIYKRKVITYKMSDVRSYFLGNYLVHQDSTRTLVFFNLCKAMCLFYKFY